MSANWWTPRLGAPAVPILDWLGKECHPLTHVPHTQKANFRWLFYDRLFRQSLLAARKVDFFYIVDAKLLYLYRHTKWLLNFSFKMGISKSSLQGFRFGEFTMFNGTRNIAVAREIKSWLNALKNVKFVLNTTHFTDNWANYDVALLLAISSSVNNCLFNYWNH